MEWAGAGLLLLSAFFSPTWTTPQRVFHFIPDQMDWPSARNYCIENFVDLASIADSTELAQIASLVKTNAMRAFVGLKREWQWTVLDSEDQREAEIKFKRFGIGQPKDTGNCGNIQPSGEWATFNCSTKLTFICYDVNIADRFVKGNDTVQFGQAKDFCRKHHTDLARIRTETENERVVSLINGTMAWIGLTQRQWSWSDWTYPGFVPWPHVGEMFSPGHGCAVLILNVYSSQPTIREWKCIDARPFFCYSFAKQKYTVRITMSTKPGVDLAGPAADSVMKMVQRQLHERGFSKDVLLTWSKRPQKVDTTPEKRNCPLHVDP